MFKPGDKVRRLSDFINEHNPERNVLKGHVYTVETCVDDEVYLKEKFGLYTSSKFVLVKQTKRDFVVKNPINKPKE